MSAPYTLYYSPGACSLAVHVLLNELGQKYDLKKVDLRAPRDPEFMKLSPRGQVPTLVDNCTPIVEGGAILAYLCDKHNSDLLPKEGLARAKALEALMFCNSSLHPACGAVFGTLRMEDASLKEKLFDMNMGKVQALLDVVEQRLKNSKYMAGDQVTVGDILLTVIANWAYNDQRPSFGPNTTRLIREISQRPAYQDAMGQEEITYKAAA